MSIVFNSVDGAVVCHKQYLEDLYGTVSTEEDTVIKLVPNEHLFLVKTPYMKDQEALKKVKDPICCQTSESLKRKYERISSVITNSEGLQIKDIYEQIVQEAQRMGRFKFIPSPSDIINNNNDARIVSEKLYNESTNWISFPFNGENNTNNTLLKKVGSESFVFPPHSRFFCRDVQDIKNNVDTLGKFDLILLDPPWWNKYIRRKKSKSLQGGYKMMYNNCLAELPLCQLLAAGGMIAVWCTNSKTHLDELRDSIFPAWGTKQIAQWTWMKVTLSGQPVCPFTKPPGKQPFEQLVFAVRSEEMSVGCRPDDGKIFLSVPSAVHSHKPPIAALMQPYLPSEPRCLEIFARYLLPNWTSWGLEVIKLQHLSLFHEDRTPSDTEKSSC